MRGRPGSASGPCPARLDSFQAGPFPRHVSFPSTASSVLRTSPTPDLSSDDGSGIASPPSPVRDQSDDPVGPLMFRCMLFVRDAAFDPGEATPSRIAMPHVLPSRLGTLSAFAIFHISRLNPAPHTTPVYTSDPASPRRPQDSVPACPLRLWPVRTSTERRSSAWHDVLPERGVAD